MQTRPLHGMFIAVPHRYDLVNHIITWFLDKRWRRKAAGECLNAQPCHILDLCCGTGDLAIDIARRADRSVEVTGIDYSEPMLRIASIKAAASETRVTFIYGDAAALPFADGYFECIGISFAFRNLTYKNPQTRIYLSEVCRVLAPGGKFVIVETSQPKSWLIRKLFHLYLRCFVANTGYWLSGKKSAYKYLAESARRFYNTEEVKELLLSSGFREFYSRPLFLGATSVYVAVK